MIDKILDREMERKAQMPIGRINNELHPSLNWDTNPVRQERGMVNNEVSPMERHEESEVEPEIGRTNNEIETGLPEEEPETKPVGVINNDLDTEK